MVDATPRSSPSKRVDAQRNRRRILDTARDLILEVGGVPPRDAVARRAGVGIGTLYRHFPDQQDLLSAVVLDVLDRVIAEGTACLDADLSGGEALRRYLHAAVDLGLGAVNVIHPHLDAPDWPERRQAAADLLDRLVEAAHRDGGVDDEVTASDVALAGIRFSRPLGIGIDPDAEREIAHRQLDTYLDGLGRHAGRP